MSEEMSGGECPHYIVHVDESELLLAGKSATPTTTVKRDSDFATNRRSSESVENKSVEKKQVSTQSGRSKPEERHRRSTQSPGKNDSPVIHGRALNRTTSVERSTQTKSKTSSTSTKTVTRVSSTVGSRLASPSKNDKTRDGVTGNVLKTTSKKLSKPTTDPNQKSIGKRTSKTSSTVTPVSSTVVSHSASPSKNDGTPLQASTHNAVTGNVLKTTSKKLSKPTTDSSKKSIGKQKSVKSGSTGKRRSVSSVRTTIGLILVRVKLE